MKKVFAIIGLGLCLSACETYDPYGYGYEYGYGPPCRSSYGCGGYRYKRYGYGHYVPARECYEVRDEYNARFLECRRVKRWRQDAPPRRDDEYYK
jgi:hypothetical protein